MAATVATKVIGVVITSSPGPIPLASSARCRADVPELTATAKRVPHSAANSASKASTSGPSTNAPLRITRATAASSSGARAACCARRSRNGIILRPSQGIISTGWPRRRIDWLAASRISTTLQPRRPSVTGVADVRMQSTKCSASTQQRLGRGELWRPHVAHAIIHQELAQLVRLVTQRETACRRS